VNDLDRRLAWGADQERLKNYAIKVISKIYKNTFEESSIIENSK